MNKNTEVALGFLSNLKSRREYFVTAVDGRRTAFLLGPYRTHEEALSHVDEGKRLACAADERAWFYLYGTASTERGAVPRTVFARDVADLTRNLLK